LPKDYCDPSCGGQKRLIHQHIPDHPHRLFLSSASFFITFLAVRLLVASITHHIGPFGYVEMGGRHSIDAALTLYEFALWLNLDAMAYWLREGREGIDAVVLFGAALAMETWGAPLFQELFGAIVIKTIEKFYAITPVALRSRR
jgi:hypothetical protein